MHRIVVFAIPVFALFIAIEFVYGWLKGRNTYRLDDTLASLSQGLLSQAVAACTQLFQIGLYTIIQPHIQLVDAAWLWDHWPGWLLAIVLYDFCDYWLHRVSHESAIFWAAHVVHHQSRHLNLSTALRQESAYPLLGWAFYLPLAVVGVPPELYAIAGLVVLLYQFWIHTEHVGSLGWFDRVFSSPSNHRVHHAVNDGYIDRNYGAIFVVWDRLFGTFQAEGEPCVYGTRVPLHGWNPLAAVTQVYALLWRRCRSTPRWRDRLRVLFKGPGWLPAEMRGQAAAPQVDLQSDRVRPGASQPQTQSPTQTQGNAWAAVVVFAGVVLACCWFLWQADDLDDLHLGLAAGATAAGLWVVGALIAAQLRPVSGSLLGLLAVAAVFAASSPGPVAPQPGAVVSAVAATAPGTTPTRDGTAAGAPER